MDAGDLRTSIGHPTSINGCGKETRTDQQLIWIKDQGVVTPEWEYLYIYIYIYIILYIIIYVYNIYICINYIYIYYRAPLFF